VVERMLATNELLVEDRDAAVAALPRIAQAPLTMPIVSSAY
jgi:hypothetical protein